MRKPNVTINLSSLLSFLFTFSIVCFLGTFLQASNSSGRTTQVSQSSAEPISGGNSGDLREYYIFLGIESSNTIRLDDLKVRIGGPTGVEIHRLNLKLEQLSWHHEISKNFQNVIAIEPNYLHQSTLSPNSFYYVRIKVRVFTFGFNGTDEEWLLANPLWVKLEGYDVDPVSLQPIEAFSLITVASAGGTIGQVGGTGGEGGGGQGGPTSPVPGQELRVAQDSQFLTNLHAYPNPLASNSVLSFKLQKASKVRIELFNSNGQLVRSFINNKSLEAGNHEISLNIPNLNKGIYFIRFDSEFTHKTVRVLK